MRLLAHITFEAHTALRFGCGDFDMLYDSPIQRDFNGLPLILGTSICGVIRANAKDIFSQERIENLFGFSKQNTDSSSKIIFSNALLLNEKMQVNESLIPFSKLKESKFLRHFLHLPQRQHNAIGAQGVCKDGAKFDEEVIYKGTRFKCAVEMECENERDKEDFFKILNLFYSPHIRFGAGSTKGFGAIKVIESRYEILQNPHDKSSSLNEVLSQVFTPSDFADSTKARFTRYTLNLTCEGTFLFGSGFGDDDADSVAVSEKVVDYERGDLSEAKLLIPASSLKGAISQRARFYINQRLGNFIDSAESKSDSSDLDKHSAQIHATLFGNTSDMQSASKGQILISDIYLDYDEKRDSQIFAHNSIDRFSASVKEGALFQEKASALQNPTFCVEIFVANEPRAQNLSQDFALATQAFEKALIDICKGALPLGAMSSKGHGFFSGELRKNGEVIYKNGRQ